MAIICMDTDLTKPYLQYPTCTKVKFGLDCGEAEMYLDAYTNAPATGNGTLRVTVVFNGHDITASGETGYFSGRLDLRLTIQISTNDFATIAQTFTVRTPINASDATGQYVYWQKGPFPEKWFPAKLYERTAIGRRPEGDTAYLTSDYAPTLDRILLWNFDIPLNLTKTAYKFRVSKIEYEKITPSTGAKQWLVANTEDDEVFSSYAPFTTTVTPPATFYANGVNTFDAVIDAAFTSELTCSWKRGGASVRNVPVVPVRNEQAPYITTGTRTEHIYLCGIFPKAQQTDYPYEWTLNGILYIQDPGNANYMVPASNFESSGQAVYHDTDDWSMVTATCQFSDLNGYYETYNYLLRNTGSVVRATVVLTLKYGITVYVRYKKFEESGATNFYNGDTSQTLYIDQNVPETGNTASTGVYVYTAFSGNIYSFTFSANVLAYAVPSFPTLEVRRCDADGTPNDGGDYCQIDWAVTITPINNLNSKKLQIVHPQGKTTYDPLDSYTQTGLLVVAASTESAYDISLTVSDDIKSITRTVKLSTALATMDLLYKGVGVAFGKVAERQYALDISPDWTLIFHKALYGAINLSNWINDVIERLDGLEQFAAQVPSTGQYQVTFYNDDLIFDRQWVRAGGDANTPPGTPARESTKKYSYSFAGWALTKGATAADTDALTNITAFRSIYAAYVATLKTYRVQFWNGDDLLETQENNQWGTAVSYSGSTPTGDGTFYDFLPLPTFVEGHMKCYATFYKSTQIADDWDTIVQKAKAKTAGDEYKVGQYKDLLLTNGNTIRLRLMGIRKDVIAGQNKAELTFMAEGSNGCSQLPRTRWSGEATAKQTVYHTVQCSAFNVTKPTSLSFRVAPKTGALGTSKITFTITVTKAGAIYHDWDVLTGRTLKIKLDGTVLLNADGSSQHGSSGRSTTLTVGEHTFEIETTLLDGENPLTDHRGYLRVYYQNNSGSNYGAFDIEKCYVKSETSEGVQRIHYYQNGTGSVGGWEHSNARKVLKEDGLPLIPQKIRENIKTVVKASKAWVSTVESDTSENDATLSYKTIYTKDALWVPSFQEFGGARFEDLSGEAEYGRAGSSFSFVNICWSRDCVNGTSESGAIYRLTSSASSGANLTLQSTSGLNTYYLPICFCL